MKTGISSSTIDPLVTSILTQIRSLVETDHVPLSSETTLRFLFAWQFGRALAFPKEYCFDFEWNAYSALDTDDRFLDLLIYTDPRFKVAFEFKLPKSSSRHQTNSTQTRAKICRDISRLHYLVENKINFIHVGYFLFATDELAYLEEGRKTTNVHYRTYQGTVYQPGTIISKGKSPNGLSRSLPFPGHEVRCEWEGLNKHRGRLKLERRFAWLNPIKVWA